MTQDPMTASHIEYLEDVRSFAKHYLSLGLEERSVVKAEVDEGEYSSTLEGDTLTKIMNDVDEYSIYSNQRRYLRCELDRTVENKYTDQDVSGMRHDYEIAVREMNRIDKEYKLTEATPEIARSQHEVREEFREMAQETERHYQELTDDNYDQYMSEMDIYSDPGIVADKPRDVLEDEDFPEMDVFGRRI